MHDFERETVIGYSDDSSKASITTYNRAMINKLDKYCKDFPKSYKLIREIEYDDKVEGKEYSFPKNLVTIRIPSTKKMSDDQKQAASDRMKKMHKNKSNK